jgi:hypothetical protein
MDPYWLECMEDGIYLRLGCNGRGRSWITVDVILKLCIHLTEGEIHPLLVSHKSTSRRAMVTLK